MSRRARGDDTGMGCLAFVFLAVFFMPIVGIYMIFSGNDDEKGIGIALTIVGIIVWAMFGML